MFKRILKGEICECNVFSRGKLLSEFDIMGIINSGISVNNKDIRINVERTLKTLYDELNIICQIDSYNQTEVSLVIILELYKRIAQEMSKTI